MKSGVGKGLGWDAALCHGEQSGHEHESCASPLDMECSAGGGLGL